MAERVLIVDDHASLREGLTRSLRAYGLNVVGDTGECAHALALVAEHAPDVVLTDVSLPDGNGITLARAIIAEHPGTTVVMLSMFADQETRTAALEAGASAYLSKDCTTSEIVAVVKQAAPSVAGEEPGPDTARVGDHLLSPRETEVLQLVADGASTQAVAKALFISLKTAKNHLSNIYGKLDVTDRTQAVVTALRLGTIQLRS